jgi:hypothetical protein
MKRHLFAATLLLLAGVSPAAAQDPFEIQVYLYSTVPKGYWNLETHINRVVRGTQSWSDPVAPTQGQNHVTLELTRGITDYFELAGYLVTSSRRDVPGELVGWRVRPRVRIPETWLPFKFSLSTEVAFPKDVYEENDVTLEVRPIFEWKTGPFITVVNPVVGRSLRGPDSEEGWDFEPGAHIGIAADDKLELSVEYYGATGLVTDPLPFKEQVHQIFAGFDYRFTPERILNVGVGKGLTEAGNTFVLKMRFGMMFK